MNCKPKQSPQDASAAFPHIAFISLSSVFHDALQPQVSIYDRDRERDLALAGLFFLTNNS